MKARLWLHPGYKRHPLDRSPHGANGSARSAPPDDKLRATRGVACDGENASLASHHVPNNAADQTMSPVRVFCKNGNAAT